MRYMRLIKEKNFQLLKVISDELFITVNLKESTSGDSSQRRKRNERKSHKEVLSKQSSDNRKFKNIQLNIFI